MLVEIGDTAPFFVVVRGAIQVLSPTAGAETVIVTHSPGQFTGEANMMTGRRSIARSRVSEDGEVIQLDRAALLALIQTDAELSAILMRAFILRRPDLRACTYILEGLATPIFGDPSSPGFSHLTGYRIGYSLRVLERSPPTLFPLNTLKSAGILVAATLR